MSLPQTYAELKAAGPAQGLASNAPGNAGVVGDTISGDILHGRGPRRGGLERLIRYWRPIMKKPGGFRRCVLELADHPELGPDVRPLCAWLHHETTGKWPNEGKHRGRQAAGAVRRVINRPGKSVNFEDLLTDDLIERLVVVAKSIDGEGVETKKGQPLVREHLGRGANGRLSGLVIPDILQDEGWKPNPIRAARSSAAYRLLNPLGGRRIGGHGIGGRGRRQIQRCPAGYQFGGRFADSQMSNCGAQLFDHSTLGGGKPGTLIPDIGAPNAARQNASVQTAIRALKGKDRGPYLVRADGLILRPLMPPGRLSAFKATKDTEGAIWVGKTSELASAGREEIRLLGNGAKSVIMVVPGGTIRVDRRGSVPRGFGRQVGALTRAATAGDNPMKRVASQARGLSYTEDLGKKKSHPDEVDESNATIQS